MSMEAQGQNQPVSEEAIAMRAYEIYLARGGEDGHDVEDWQQAEAEPRGGQSWQPRVSEPTIESSGMPSEGNPGLV